MRKYIISLLLVAVLVTPLFATTTNKIHDFATGIMHSADTISFTPTVEITSTNVQEAISGIGSSYATKAYVNGTDENIINTLLPAKANASYVTGSTETALLTHTGNTTNPHGMTISNLPTLSGTNTFTGTNNFTGPVSLTDGTNTSTMVPAFRTDKSKCVLLIDFDGTLIDKVAGKTPTNYSTANRWSDNTFNDSTTKTTITSLGGSFETALNTKFGGGAKVLAATYSSVIPASTDAPNYTIHCWVKMSVPAAQKIFLTLVGETNFTVETDGKMKAGLSSASTNVIADGTWKMVDIVLSGAASKVYINGNLEITYTMSTGATGALLLGSTTHDSSFSNFVVLNHVLTLAQIKQIYFSSQSIVCEGAITPSPAWNIVETFTNSWVAHSDAVRYVKKGNIVTIQGLVKSGASGDSIFTIPAGYRPLTNTYFPMVHRKGTTTEAALFTVGYDGLVTPTFATTTPDWISICCTFEAVQ